MRNQKPLFFEISWSTKEQRNREELIAEINNINENKLLNSSISDLNNYFEQKYKIDVPILKQDDISVDQKEADVPAPFPFYDSKFVKGTEISVFVPFEGDSEVFKMHPDSFTLNPPRAEITSDKLIIKIPCLELSSENVKNQINSTLNEIEKSLNHLRNNIQSWNTSIRTLASTQIEKRRDKLLKNRGLLSSLGYKIKEREGNLNTYIAPEIKRKITPSLPVASSSPYRPEPTLENIEYEYILNTLQNMMYVMEKSPSAFSSMNEESIRFHFLVQLNGQYEGQATGETFNYQGKTDILIRSEGKNIFIAECKFWNGQETLNKTIDQLLNYLSWRDTKTAILIFNKNKDFSNVLKIAQETAKKHSNFKREYPLKSSKLNKETTFQYIFAHKEDYNRELCLTIMMFDIPN